MNAIGNIWIATSIFFALSATATAQSSSDWVDIKDAKELRALYSNKTFRGVGWVGHFRDDGKGILISGGGKPEPRTWKVEGNDQVCVTKADNSVTCNRFQRNRKKPQQHAVTQLPSGMTFTFDVEDGIPKF